MRVLVVAYYFPPIGGGGVNRTVKLVRSLVARGDTPLILTVDDAAWVRDPALVPQIPSRARVLRLPNPDWGRVVARRATPARAGRGAPGPGRLRRWLVPDLHVGWSAIAAPVAALLAATRSIDVVYTTCPPYSAHAPGGVAGALGVPWVADFRDGWTACPTRLDLPSWRMRLESRMELAVLARADRVLFASEAARAHALAKCPAVAARSETVLTGFDRDEVEPWRNERAPHDRFEIVHAGSVLVNHMGPCFDRFLEALSAWSAADPEVARTTRVRFIGAESELAARIADAGLSSFVEVESAVARGDLPRRLSGVHACLALTSEARFGTDPIPGKVFDAAGAGRPLLALCNGGALGELVERLDLGAVASPQDSARIAQLLEGWRRGALAGLPPSGPPESSRAALENGPATARIAAVLENAVASRREGAGACPSPSAS